MNAPELHTIELRPIGELTEAPQNSRLHPETQIDQIAEAMVKFGWTIPVLIDESGMIIAGHARVRAGKKVNMDQVPCIVAEGWSEEKKEAYQIADNRLSELSEWDEEVLGDQIKRLNAAKFDMGFLDMSGFSVDLFKPNLDPKISTGDVTGDAIKKAQAGQDTKFEGQQKQAYEVVCPHCAEAFDVTL